MDPSRGKSFREVGGSQLKEVLLRNAVLLENIVVGLFLFLWRFLSLDGGSSTRDSHQYEIIVIMNGIFSIIDLVS